MASNGRLTSAELTTVQGTIKLAKDTAVDFKALKAAAAKKGVDLSIAKPLGGYRSLAQQAALKANPRKYGSGLPSSAIASAGYSTHGTGVNFDVVGAGALAFVKKYGKAYGFTQRDARNDPNCIHHTGGVHAKPAPVALKATERKTNHTAYSYTSPKRATKYRAAHHKKGEVITFVSYTDKGQKVGNSTRWYKASSGHFMPAYRFTENSTTGLTNLDTPIAPTS